MEADRSIICLSRGRTFRHDIYPSYKSNRKQRKPVGLKPIKDWLIETRDAKVKLGIEADDTLGILATHPKMVKGEKVIVSQDKDLLTIPGTIYHKGKLIEVSQEEADYNHLLQTLTGDSTDGYPGCPGVGPTKARKVLDESATWEALVETFEKAGVSEEDALTQARLARILRYTDYDFKRKEVKLWTPSSR